MPMLRLQGAVNEVALELQCLDGTRLPALVNATAERDGGGRTTLVGRERVALGSVNGKPTSFIFNAKLLVHLLVFQVFVNMILT